MSYTKFSSVKPNPNALGSIVEAQGWSDETLLDLALDFIMEHDMSDAFEAQLREIAAAENAANGLPYDAATATGMYDHDDVN